MKNWRESLTSGVVAVEVGIQSLVAHFVNLLHIIRRHVVKKLFQIASRIDIFQLFLVHI